ncbi:hypothetical protein [Nonomuraea sp. NPDC049709]|uniref:hypothetical protein n=1 Tax=Nonomuraea sp. NPDC049709 TaxID=3154736 RepID=UPI00343A84D2
MKALVINDGMGRRSCGMPVEQGIGPIVARIDDPPAEPLGAFARTGGSAWS